MKKRGGVRWQWWVAAFAALSFGAGAATGCDDDTGGETTQTGTGTGTGAGTTPTGTGTGTGNTTTTTSDTGPGCGGGPACDALCAEASAKQDACLADAGLGEGGAGGGGTQINCDEEGICVSLCIMNATCQDIVIQDEFFSNCVNCCTDPYLC